jgi:hypothetical protein
MIDHPVQGMAAQPHAVDRRAVAEQAGARRRAEPGPAESASVGGVDVEVQQPGRRPAVLDGDAGPLDGVGRLGGPQDRIGPQGVPVTRPRLHPAEAAGQFGQSPAEQRAAARRRLARSGDGRGREHDGARPDDLVQRRLAGVARRQDVSPQPGARHR